MDTYTTLSLTRWPHSLATVNPSLPGSSPSSNGSNVTAQDPGYTMVYETVPTLWEEISKGDEDLRWLGQGIPHMTFQKEHTDNRNWIDTAKALFPESGFYSDMAAKQSAR
jgi:hypothetical protein